MKDIRVRNVSDDIHILFKTACVKDGKSMNDVLLELIRDYAESKKEDG